jgi:2-methylisocitrate lyase-like PEP mutase family enzyme
VPGRQFANVSQAAGNKPTVLLADLERAGAAAVTFPSLALFAAAAAVRGVMRTLHGSGAFDQVASQLISLADYNRTVDLDARQAAEDGYMATAVGLVQQRRGGA